jgi:hypothetical protein
MAGEIPDAQCAASRGWVDAKGMFLSAVGAGPVYKLLGKKDLGPNEFPPPKTALIDGDIAFRQHSGGHTTGPNGPTFLTFASRYIKEPAKGALPRDPLSREESDFLTTYIFSATSK